jgi:uncharacterized membrane protein YfcA
VTDVLLALPFGLAIGLALGGVGRGGSILAVPLLVYALGFTPHQATAASLVIVGSATGRRQHRCRCAAALWASAVTDDVAAIVSRGDRPDLAARGWRRFARRRC